jgi:phytoene/squalene synthetase
VGKTSKQISDAIRAAAGYAPRQRETRKQHPVDEAFRRAAGRLPAEKPKDGDGSA